MNRSSLRIEVTWRGGTSLGWLMESEGLRGDIGNRSWYVYEFPFPEDSPARRVWQELSEDEVGALLIARHGQPQFIKIVRGLE